MAQPLLRSVRPIVPLPAAFVHHPLAHRGLHNRAARRVENTISAFQAAIDQGYGIELDVQMSADGQAMVFHDDTLDRLTGDSGPIRACTAADLAQIELCDSDDRIPTLADVLTLVADRVPVLIEIKEQLDTMGATEGRLEAAVAATIAGYRGPLAVMSFNPHCVDHMARLAPGTPRGLTTDPYDPQDCTPLTPETCERLRAIPDYDATGCSFISHQVSDLLRPRVLELKAKGAAILCWTVRSLAQEVEARQIADGITFENYAAALSA